jgi:plasmid maintenance system antidote protein VapI
MNKHEGSTLESFFEELGELDEVKAQAAKKILAIKVERRMKELGLSTTSLASRMRTSRNQIHRILDQEDAGITLKMLFRLANALQMLLTVSLEADSAPALRKKPAGPRTTKALPKPRAAGRSSRSSRA